MQRKKRHLRIRSISFSIGNFSQKFNFDMNEQMIDTSEDKINKINNIKSIIQNQKFYYSETFGLKNNPKSNLESLEINPNLEKNNSENQNSSDNSNNDILIELSGANSTNYINGHNLLNKEDYFDQENDDSDLYNLFLL